jgi:hypothetical protein
VELVASNLVLPENLPAFRRSKAGTSERNQTVKDACASASSLSRNCVPTQSALKHHGKVRLGDTGDCRSNFFKPKLPLKQGQSDWGRRSRFRMLLSTRHHGFIHSALEHHETQRFEIAAPFSLPAISGAALYARARPGTPRESDCTAGEAATGD